MRALLVGVTDYPRATTPGGYTPLEGPQFDVDLMERTLETHGFAKANIAILEDEAFRRTRNPHPVSGPPTHRNILNALERIAAETHPCDFVAIYLSGHGSREPEPPRKDGTGPRKPDGLSEIFLPIDVGRWDDEQQRVRNALTDTELAERIAQIRLAGGFVWLIADSCHSGTLGRSGRGGQVREIPPSALGIPEKALRRARERGTSRSDAAVPIPATLGEAVSPEERDAESGFVAFYAAHADFLAHSDPLPPDGRGIVHGVLSYYLAHALDEPEATRFADLVPAIRNGYAESGYGNGDVQSLYATLATKGDPYFEGDLNAPLPWAQGGSGRTERGFAAVKKDGRPVLLAGTLDGIVKGTTVQIELSGHNPPFVATVSVSRALESELSVPSAERWDDGQFARAAILHVPARTIAVSLPSRTAGGEAERRVQAAIARMGSSADFHGVRRYAVRFLVPGARQADIALAVEGGRIILSADGMNPASFAIGNGDAPTLALRLRDAIFKVATARDVLQTTGAMAQSRAESDAALRKDLSVKAYLWKPPGGVCVMPYTIPEGTPLPSDVQKNETPLDLAALEAGKGPVLGQCEAIVLDLHNLGEHAIDVSPLYIDGNAGITLLGPQTGLRLAPSAEKEQGFAQTLIIPIFTRQPVSNAALPAGLEQLALIAAGRAPHDPVVWSYRDLAQSEAGSRGASAPSAFFGETAFVFRWTVAPPPAPVAERAR